ncbi:MAG: SagB/ThcOx family dehydrogenase [Chlorobium sp.]|jgi:SagB-type dehydrogenase family enzyme|uniref:SagB/ThcOx family dehydrogenase n=1 Tax=Chlorobium sp. TaxID=1095 RepID=UPI0025B80B1C|nr:SagB/ThcOx family dehydrogenase [Chlorobium sp.]MCF8217208.1 SagB/ThcOx family dehydrogenase [Chlorobium sp.]MCF8272059.1 SagB/ThcOx family dehydrogenase [Chlorobium sp.]MCF8288427.1 SagB/ThcOx family dehydrogenase [Chlorobium sp.]MCF8292017.1 SagB/ThcOx family dehydrogenase [Chlorobium sp.]MCF8386119.1 SagB/ThcOx family dehydrogenase [Chlorobium sp.]
MDSINLESRRDFLKDTIRQLVDFSETDQYRSIPPPPLQKPYAPDSKRIDLPPVETLKHIGHIDLRASIAERASCRSYSVEPLALEELSFMLWATQGIKHRIDAGHALRTVPSAGCRHAFETYLSVHRIDGLEKGIYRYLPIEHQLLFEFEAEHPERSITRAALGQQFAGEAAVTFIWTVIPYRMEWRYGLAAHKVIALDAGHVCQNLYLASEAIGAGTCAIAAYDQKAMDNLLRIDGKEEFAIYLAPAGKKP